MKLPDATTSPFVLEFLSRWNLENTTFLDYEDMGLEYEADFCHVSAKHIVSQRGGKRVHGWSLWQFDDPAGKALPVIVGDFHSVWEAPDGMLKDITPPKIGGKTLFVPDPSLAIKASGNTQLLHNNRTNDPNFPRLWNGSPTSEEYFAVINDQPSLVAYCKKLGMKDTSML